MTGLLAWLLASKLGRWVLASGLILAIGGLVAARLIALGKGKAQAEAAQATLHIILKKVASDETINRMSASQRREYVRRWVRKE